MSGSHEQTLHERRYQIKHKTAGNVISHFGSANYKHKPIPLKLTRMIKLNGEQYQMLGRVWSI